MLRLLSLLAGRATLILPGSVALGLIFPDLAAWLRPLVTPLVLGLLAIAMIRTDWPALRHLAMRPRRVILALGFIMIGLALVVAPAARWLGLPPGLALVLSLMCLCPPITSAPALAPLLGLNQPLSLMVAVAGMLVVPITLPPMALFLLDLQLDVSVAVLMLRLAALIGGALAIALVARALLRRRLQKLAAPLDGAGVVMLVIFAIAIFDGVAAKIAADPWHVALFVLAAFGAHVAYQIVALLVFARFGRRDACTVGFLSGTRNMGLLLAVLPAGADPSILLFVATAQFPIYIMPTLLQPIYARYLGLRGKVAG